MVKEVFDKLDPVARKRIKNLKKDFKTASEGYRGVLVDKYEGYILALRDTKMITERERVILYNYFVL